MSNISSHQKRLFEELHNSRAEDYKTFSKHDYRGWWKGIVDKYPETAHPYNAPIPAAPAMPPIAPSIVFLGLRIGAILCFPAITPAKYAHVSQPHDAIITSHIVNIPSSVLTLMRNKKDIIIATYTTPKKDIITSSALYFGNANTKTIIQSISHAMINGAIYSVFPTNKVA